MPVSRTQDSEIHFSSTAATSVPAAASITTKIPQVTGWDFSGGTSPDIDTTDIDSTAKEFVKGLKDRGTITININYDPTEAAFTTIAGLAGDGLSYPVMVTMNKNGTPQYRRFLVQFDPDNISADTDNIVKGTITAKITGDIVTGAGA